MIAARDERGQTIVLTVLALVVLLGMGALVLDVGSWFRQKRQLQATADAAALAGAQFLPSGATAQSQAVAYGTKNGGGVLAADVTITSSRTANDTIAVKAKKTNPGTFSRVLGIASANIGASAKARVATPLQALHVAPMVVDCNHPLIKKCVDNARSPRFNVPTTLQFDPLGAPGAFGMLNLEGDKGTPGTRQEANWIRTGYDEYLDLGMYRSDPGAKFNAQEVLGALDDRLNSVLLFPVYRTLTGQGQEAQYQIIGWIGFYLQRYAASGTNATLTGYFTEFIAQGIQAAKTQQTPPNFGVKSIQLIG